MPPSVVDSTEVRLKPYHVGNVRTALLDEARGLLREGGLSNLNLRTLSTRTGVALGSVYHHFGSKADLLAVLAAQGFDRLTQGAAHAAASAEERVVRAWILAYFDFAWREPELYSLMFQAQVARVDDVRAARDRAFQSIEDVVVATQQAQDYSTEVRHSIAVAIWTCTHGAASLAPIQDEGSDLVEAMITGLEALFRAVRANQHYPNNVREA